MLIISESSPKLQPSASANDIRKVTQTAEMLGIKVYHIPQVFSTITIVEAFQSIPVFDKLQTAFWVGYVPTPSHYQAVYTALSDKNIRLINSPEEFRHAEEFDQYYPSIASLTCQSRIATSIDEALQAAKDLGYPVFVKGTIQSFKKWGWSSCVADNELTLKNLFKNLFNNQARSLGKVIVRELIPLKYADKTGTGFPKGREYRVFLLYHQVVAYSYYWDGQDPWQRLSFVEEQAVLQLATTASQLMQVPYVAIDIGQKENGEWLVIEAGDAQFSGICQIPPIQLWQQILSILSRVG